MAYTPIPQNYVQCPYEKSHVILIEKMQIHLTKCEYVNRSTSPMTECPFNSTHRIREIEMNYHVLYGCSDRHKFENFIYSTQHTTCIYPTRTVECTSSENWDNENVSTYNPTAHCENKRILMTLQGVTPSERKTFRKNQRKKMQTLPDPDTERREPLGGNKQPARLPKSEATTITEPDNAPTSDGNQTSPGTSQHSEDDQDGFQVPRYLSRGRGRGRRAAPRK